LPTVRELATHLGLAANTVARAYRELERTAVVETRGRRGTFVAQGADRAAVEAAEAFAARLRELGVDADRGVELARRALGGGTG
jgi:DNA-binding transcriptional regulator YhcF (GntR family)